MAGLDLAACWIDSAHCRMRSRILTLSTPRFERFPECKPLARVALRSEADDFIREGSKFFAALFSGLINRRQVLPGADRKPAKYAKTTDLEGAYRAAYVKSRSAQDEMGQPARRGRIAWKELWKPHFVDCNCCRSASTCSLCPCGLTLR